MSPFLQRRLLPALIGLSVTTTGAAAFADVMLEPNVIHGQVRFTNTDPAVVALLDHLGMKSSGSDVVATSILPAGFSSNTWALPGGPMLFSYELSAESGAGGPPGVIYSLQARAAIYTAPDYPGSGTASGTYIFQPNGNVVLYPAPSPGTLADLEECVGLVHIRWGLDDSCVQPATVHKGHIYTSYSVSSFNDTSEHYVLQLGGTSETRTLSTTIGTDPTLDTISFTTDVDLHPGCDEIQEICINIGPYVGDGDNLGALTGPYDVVGETEQGTTRIDAFGGPGGNERWGYFSPPEMPLGAPATWWTLPNLVPGDYWAQASSVVRTGREANELRSPRMGPGRPPGPATVVAGTTGDMQKVFDGSSRYPFVMHPAFIKGSILLADPYVTANPGTYSTLSAIVFSTDAPASTAAPQWTYLVAYDVPDGYGLSVTSFPGSFDAATGLFSSSYQQVIANTYDLPTKWRQDNLRLYFQDALHDRNGTLSLRRDPTGHDFAPGDVVTIDHRYCFNEITLPYSTASGALFNPSATISGGLSGTDWEGNVTSYTASGTFYGSPTSSGAAAQTGEVHLALPQGSYTITPGASIVSESGGISTANFESASFTAGCGQRIVVTPGLAVSLDQLPPCAPAAEMNIAGQIDSGGDPVDRIWYTINGGPEIDLCPSNCGPNPAYSATVGLEGCENDVQVFASVGAHVASVTAQTVWDDPSDGAACAGESCNPPASTCAEVKAETVTCQSDDLGWTGTYEVSFTVNNNTSAPIVHILLPDPHLSPHSLTLASPLQPGDSATVTVMVSGMNPESTACFDVGLTDADDNACCSQEVCVPLPECCFTADKPTAACVPGAPAGTITYSFGMVNHTNGVIEYVYLYPPDGVSVTPDFVDVPSVVPGDVAPIGPLTFTGASPGEKLCVTVGIHNEDMSACCEEEICFKVPEPCAEGPDDGCHGDDSPGCSVSLGSRPAHGPIGAGALLGLAALACLRWRRRARRRAVWGKSGDIAMPPPQE